MGGEAQAGEDTEARAINKGGHSLWDFSGSLWVGCRGGSTVRSSGVGDMVAHALQPIGVELSCLSALSSFRQLEEPAEHTGRHAGACSNYWPPPAQATHVFPTRVNMYTVHF